MFTIDFTKPWLYKDIIYFNQGNLSTNNTLRCKLVTGGSDDFTGGSIACTFTTKDSVEISGFGKLIDSKNGIIDIVFPSNSLVVGTNKLEVLVNRADGGVAQSPPVMYDIWQGLTTGNGIEAETNYPILIQLINSTNEASNKANLALNKANSMITDMTDAIDNAYRSANDADIATSKAYSKIEEVENAKVGMINKVDTEIANMKTQVNASTNTMTSKIDMKIADVDSAIASGTKDLEVKEARRDMAGVEHDTLKLRLESDLKKGKVIEETKEGTYLSFDDTVGGLVSYLEVLGNTVQDVTNLSNIRSSCIPNGDGTFKMSILSVSENLFNKDTVIADCYPDHTNGNLVSSNLYYTSDYIKIDASKTYVRNIVEADQKRYAFYDKDRKFTNGGIGGSLVPNQNSYYVRVSLLKADLDKFKLQEGTISTPYTPYEETRCDIKLPCQLEKWDRLYFDKEENAWVVDKNMDTILINSKIFSTSNTPVKFDTCIRLGINYLDLGLKQSYVESDSCFTTFGTSLTRDEWVAPSKEGVYIGKTALGIVINKSTIGGDTKELMKAYFEGKNHLFKRRVDINDVEKIVLPQSEQIKLNSFANKTHVYAIGGDVDATVKATVSKSLASTVQANTEEVNKINNAIADIQGLKESQDFAYETDKGYLVCKDTQNGVVKDLKLCGKSLVNICNNDFTKTNTGIYYHAINKSTFPFNKDVSIKVFKENDSSLQYLKWSFYGVDTDGVARVIKPYTEDFSQATLNIKDTYPSYRLYLQSHDGSNYVDFDRNKVKACIVKGNVQIDSFFEVITSVGNGNEIEVLSRNENMLEFASIGSTGLIVLKDKLYNGYITNYSNSKVGLVIRNSDTTWVKDINIMEGQTVDLSSILLEGQYTQSIWKLSSNITMDNYKALIHYNLDLKQDKKTILFKDSDNTWKPILNLRGVDENRCDIIDTSTNSYIKIMKEIVEKGEGSWQVADGSKPNTIMFLRMFSESEKCELMGNNPNILCNTFIPKYVYSLDEEGIFINRTTESSSGGVYIRINQNRLETRDVAGLKKWLQSNNTGYVYKSDIEYRYEINPIYPDSYENETMISIGSGAIAPHASWKITSSLPNFVKELSNQIKQLQEQVYKTNVANFAVALNTLDTKLRLDRLEAPQM